MCEVFLRKIAPSETDEGMFYWKNSSEPLEEMSKCDILRGIVTEKLSTALQEILAVLQRTVSGYEEEALGLRREISRQRSQLELLQPRVSLQRRALVPDAEDHDVEVSPEEEEEQQPAEQETGSLGMLWYDDDEDDEEEEQPTPDPKDPDFQITPRLISPRARSDRRRPGRPRGSIILRVCLLEDARTLVLSNSVFKRHPVQELCCPPGLSEEGFLLLLRSSFPRLTESFELFTSDRTKTLRPLRLEALTPERILSSVRASALYIRLKSREDSGSRGSVGPQEEPSPSGSITSSADETEASSSVPSPRVPSVKRRRGRPRLWKQPPHHVLRVCMLGTHRSDVLSNKVFKRHPVQELCCPPGLSEQEQQQQEEEEEQVQQEEEEEQQQQQEERRLSSDVVMKTDEAGFSSSPVQRAVPCSNAPQEQEVEAQEQEEETQEQEVEAQEQELETQGAAYSSEDGAADEASDGHWKADPDLRPSGARRGKLTGKTACRVCGVSYVVQGSLIKHAWSHADDAPAVCGVCGNRYETSEDLKSHLKKYKKTHECSFCRKSFLTVTGLKCHVTLHTGDRPFKCDLCGKAFAHASNLSIHRWVHREERPHKCDVCPKAFGMKAQLQAHRRTHGQRERFSCGVCGKSLLDMRSLTRHKSTHSGERRYGCEICGKRFKLPGTLRSHEKIHTVRERPFLCHICCKTFISNSGLKMHEKTHAAERPFPCAVCGKGFISNGERNAHMRVHTGEAPHGCSECGRFFKRKTHLNNHVRSHMGIKLFVCSVCGKACSRQEHLTVHMRTHNGERPYQCTVCEKAFTQSHCLKTHMKSHRRGDQGFLNARVLEDGEPTSI
ncbi:zinc finger protein 30-like isoform X2 [Eleginops maclovinus]|uniref:zinc finger protein 30-like isoform X2 n=1 Tax=Eleginops maclovinus TaxID=56733 RepID=UPI0030805BEF